MQTFGVLKEVLKYHYHTYGLIMGGTNRQEEAKKLAKGINILVATPGRLLDHMQVHTDSNVGTCRGLELVFNLLNITQISVNMLKFVDI